MGDINGMQMADAAHILGVGLNGSGKTGSLASLAEVGFKLRILDYDQGFEILKQMVKKDVPTDIDVETFNDVYWSQPGTGRLVAKDSTAFPKSMQTLANWPKYGSPSTWGLDTVLVMDSLTFMGKAAMNHVAKMKGKLASMDPKDFHPSQPDWGDAMGLQENLLAMLKGLPCHVIVFSHVTFLTPDGELTQQGFPSALGSKLPPKVGSYFNHTLYYNTEGAGSNKKRTFSPTKIGLVQTKTSAPGKVKDSYPIETGLADYFRDLGIPFPREQKAA